MAGKELQKNKMGTMPVGKLIINMSLPMMISMMVQALYNIVDSMFVAKISEAALTAVSLAYPIQSLLIAIGVGTGVGVNALLSRSLGMRDQEGANKAAANGMFLAVATYIVFCAISLPLLKPFLMSQTKNEEIINYGMDYLWIICIFSFSVLIQLMVEKILQSTGRTSLSMISQAIGAVINLIFDPILIFGFWKIPAMGVAGAAIATVFGQFVGAAVGIIFCIKYTHEIRLNLKKFRPDSQIIKRIYSVGLPSIIMQSISSVFVYAINGILIAFTTTATAVFGVYYKVQNFVFMPVFGLNNGMVPIISYNYGAGDRERIMKTYKICVIFSYVIMGMGLVLTQVFPERILEAFNADEAMLAIGVPALRIISLMFIPSGYSVIFSSFSQALGNGVYSMVLSILRQLVILLPIAWLLSRLGNLETVWWSFLIAETIGTIISLFFTRNIIKTRVNTIGTENDLRNRLLSEED